MSKPLTEIINEINSKINRKQECATILELILRSVEQQQNKFTSSKNSKDSLRITRDDHPTICCVSKKCMSIERILNTDIYQNIQKVCRDADGDFLRNTDISEKKFRKNINRPGYCETCGCAWTDHVFNEYNLNQFFELVQTPSGEKKWDPNVSQTLVELLEKNKKAIKKFAQEKSFILEVGRKFGAFLSKNSILASNDAFEQFLLQSIEEERKMSQLMEDTSKLNALIQAHEEYKHERNQIENWLDVQDIDISIEEIFLLQEDLFNNKHFGAKIKKIWDEELSQYQAIQCVEHFIGSNNFEEIERL
uniref:Uncharacterized protein n=1 Tax=Acrobeloides nanus TaxID=290746 RepID=A0A914DTB0_9BILA